MERVRFLMEIRRTSQSTKRHDGRRRQVWVPVTQTPHQTREGWDVIRLIVLFYSVMTCVQGFAAGGVLVVNTEDETSSTPIAARMELLRGEGKPQVFRRGVSAGIGFVVNESIELSLPDGPYQFRFVRGPEYRIIQGNFTLERTSQDARTLRLPRMVDMASEGWLSGDMAIPSKTPDLALRMIAEDLHFGSLVDAPGASPPLDKLLNNASGSPTPYAPLWTASSALFGEAGELLCYTIGDLSPANVDADHPPVNRSTPSAEFTSVVAATTDAQQIELLGREKGNRIAIHNPFAWQLPIWIATRQIDGMFVLCSDWLREGQRIEKITRGRAATESEFRGPHGPGRYAERVYWNLLDCGLRLVPLAGTSADSKLSASQVIGYNRIYAMGNPPHDIDDSVPVTFASVHDYMDAVWSGRSMVTNGPMLRVKLEGFPPGHAFSASRGEDLELSFDVKLSVRDPVDYLEVVHDGRIVYSARLDEFAAAGGVIPLLKVKSSGWALVRVVTQFADHYRMAMTAPWYFDVDQTPRVSGEAVSFFERWLEDCESQLKQLPSDEISKHSPQVLQARRFWKERRDQVNAE